MKNVKFLITIVPVVIIDYVINMLLHRQSTILGSTLNEVLVVDIITIASVVFYMVFLDTIYMKRFGIGLNYKYYFTGVLIYCIFDIAVVQLFLYNSVKYDGLFYAGLAVISLTALILTSKKETGNNNIIDATINNQASQTKNAGVAKNINIMSFAIGSSAPVVMLFIRAIMFVYRT